MNELAKQGFETLVDTPSLAEWQSILLTTFTHIQETRMQGVPVLNSSLQICTKYFVPWTDYYLGALITPWFLNLTLLPATENSTEEFRKKRIGEKQTHVFPSGPYEFIVNREEALGNYQACSLFSPMFEFKDQIAVEDTATAILVELMKSENYELLDAEAKRFEQEKQKNSQKPTSEIDPLGEQPNTKPKQTLTRRQLLRGK